MSRMVCVREVPWGAALEERDAVSRKIGFTQ